MRKIFLILCIAALMCMISLAMPGMAADSWNGDSFSNQSRVYVNGTSSTLTDYQIKFVLHNVTGDNTAENIYLPDIIQPNYNDVRFTLSDGTQLNYWMETPTGTNNATFWVKIPFIPQGTENSVAIDIYNGNSTIDSKADGDATFPLFDDFDETSLNTSKWAVTSGTAAVSNSQLVLSGAATKIYSIKQFQNNASLSAYFNYVNIGYSSEYFGFSDTAMTEICLLTFYNPTKFYTRAAGKTDTSLTAGSISSMPFKSELKWNRTAVTAKVASNPSVVGIYTPSISLPIFMRGRAGDSINWLFVRQLADVEPTIYTPLQPPVANFTADTLSGDAPLTVEFTDQSTGVISTWAWDFNNDGIIDNTTQNTTYIYQIPGTYTVNLTVANYGGSNTSVKTNYILVTTPSSATADFTADTTSGAAPLTVHFSGQSTGIVTDWIWDFNNDGKTDATTQNATYTYSDPGNYTVNLTVKNAGGSNSIIKTDYINVSGVPPVADFLSDVTTGKAALMVNFTDNSIGSVSGWIWDFNNDGVIDATTQNASYTYERAGNYTVNLTVTGPAGSNSIIKTNYIQAISNIDLSGTAAFVTSYPNYNNTIRVTIANLGTENATAFNVTLLVGENSVTLNIPELAAETSTTFSVTDIKRQVGDTVQVIISVDPENAISEADETNNEYTTNVTISTTEDLWQGGRFSIGSDLVNNAVYEEGHIGAVYSVGSTYYTWFTKTGTVTYTTDDLPIPADATIKSARLYQGWTWYGYPGFTVQFNGHESQEPVASHSDNINGQDVFDVTPYFNVSGSNTAVITAGRSQAGYYGTVLVVIYESTSEPYCQIWINEGSDCLLYGTKDPYVSYTLMDNVSTESLKSAKLTTILESRDGDDGQVITLNGKALKYTGSGGSDPSFMYFNATSALQNGTNELGVNGSSSYTNYAASILEITKETASEANFTADTTSGSAPLTVNFTDTSTGTPANWTWVFGDGETSSEQNPSHTYTAEGTYTVKLTVSNSLGSDSEEKIGYITVGSVVLAPVAEFSADQTTGNAPLTVQFKDESTNTPTSWTWDFGDGEPSSEQNPTHTYETTGTYTVKLTATNYGGSNSTTKTDYITVTSDVSAPVASFTADANSGKVPFTVQFTDTSTGKVSSWKWDFGDGSTSAEQNPNHTYVTEGSYNVTLTATGPGGSSTATSTEPAVVSAPLTADSYNGGIPLTTVQNGTVSGGLWFDSYPGFNTSAQMTFTLPDYTDIKWARLYVDVYDGHMENNYRGNVDIGIDANGDSTYELQKSETFNTSYSFPGEGGTGPVWLSDHMNRVTSDYLMWYDLTDEISGQTVNVQATTTKTDSSFDGRVKAMTLVVAYDDGDSDQVYYWVNQGHDTVNPLDETYTGLTSFGTSTLESGWSSANLSAIYLASVDGTYTFNEKTLSSGVKSGSYYGDNTWDISSLLTAEQDSALAYDKTESNYYKIPLALMSVRYPSSTSPSLPDAAFAADVMSGTAPLTVNFTDQSTGSPTSWLWDFDNDGNVDSEEQNPSYTYEKAGTYTVNLTVSNADGSDSELKTDYIVVSNSETPDTTKPAIESIVLFPANTTASSTINISVNATDDVGVTEVTAGEVQLTKTDGVWQGSITAPSSVGSYSLSINATDAAGNVAEATASYSVVKLSGSATIAASPKSNSVKAGNNVSLNIKVKNTQNIDDTFVVKISVSELSASYRADLSWFSWDEKVVTLKAGEQVLIPIEVTVPSETATGYKLFRAKVNSETSSVSALDTGYLIIS